MTTDPLDPYAVLNIPRSADARTVHMAYRALARRHHPDIAPGPDAEHRMADLNIAHAILRDPARRACWDEAHRLDMGASHALSRPHVTTVRADQSHPTQCVWRRGPDGEGAAGPPPGRPAGSVLRFGRHLCWSIGEIARVDLGYLQWLSTRPEAQAFRTEIEAALQSRGRRANGAGHAAPDRAPFWRR